MWCPHLISWRDESVGIKKNKLTGFQALFLQGIAGLIHNAKYDTARIIQEIYASLCVDKIGKGMAAIAVFYLTALQIQYTVKNRICLSGIRDPIPPSTTKNFCYQRSFNAYSGFIYPM